MEQTSPFGIVLKQQRLAAGLSQEELAARAGLSPHGISDLERGARRAPRPSTLRLLADALGLGEGERAAFLRAASAAQPALDARAPAAPHSPSAPAQPEDPTPAITRESPGATTRPLAAKAVSGEFPPLRTLDVRRHNLPIQPTPLLGRQREVERVTALLRREDVRLVTLTGPGGVGKTRLSIQVAAESLESFPDGVWLVRLSRLTDAALVLPAIAQTLGLRETPGQSPADALRARLRERRLLLLLDNFEQVVAAAPDVAALLADCPGLKVLVTSRARLRVRGEHEQAVEPLALPPDPSQLPPPGRLTAYAAVALFVERAQAVRPAFQVTDANAEAVAGICARLDGLPLAIELAAARVKLLPPHALLAQLERRLGVLGEGARDLEERQQTMERALAWSEDLLAQAERTLFHRLSVFAGAWTLEAAEAVCAAPAGVAPLALDVLDGLAALADHSLVRGSASGSEASEGDEPRFAMLNVIREYGLAQLDASGEAQAVRDAHAAYFADRARAAGKAALALSNHTQGPWKAWLAQERDNLRGALAWSSAQSQMNQALWIASAGRSARHGAGWTTCCQMPPGTARWSWMRGCWL